MIETTAPPPVHPPGEHQVSLREAARRIPSLRGGRPVAPATLLRWVLRGSRLPGGGRVRLEGWRYGASWTTTLEALDRFIAALTAASLPTTPTATPTARDERRAKKVGERAGAELAAAGW